MSLVCQGASYLLIRSGSERVGGQTGHVVLTACIFLLSGLLSVAIYLARRKSRFRAALLVRLVLILGLIHPLGGEAGVRMMLMGSTILEVSVYERFPTNLALSALSTVVVVLYTLALSGPSGGIPRSLVHEIVVFGIVSLTLAVAGSLVTRYRDKLVALTTHADRLGAIVDQLTQAQSGLHEYAFDVERRSKLEERHSISRDIHDTIGYTLTNLIMMMEAAADLVYQDPQRVRQMLASGRKEAEEGFLDTRRILHLTKIAEVEKVPLFRSLYGLAKTLEEATHVSVRLQYGNLPPTLGSKIDSAVYRIVQEGITNALGHGKATRITINCWRDGRVASIRIRDNGSGSSSVEKGIGLSGMEERADKLGGTITARNVADGFEVHLQVPLDTVT